MNLKPIQPWVNEDAPFGEIGYVADWAEPNLIITLTPEQLKRVQPMVDTAIMDLYEDRYIAIHPYERWHRLFNTRLRGLVNRWGPQLAQLIDDSGIDLRDGGDVGLKEKTINSQYPNTSLNPSEEAYASEADDHVNNRRTRLGAMAALSEFNSKDTPYQDPISAIAERMESLFSMFVY